MRLTIRHPAGLEISFEGDEAEFERFTRFLADPPSLVGILSAEAPVGETHQTLPPPPAGAIRPQGVAERMRAVGASSDVERVTVMAQLAVEAGRDGIDYPEVNRLFEALGERKPANLRQTFANAKRSGFVRSAGQGRWAPTVVGENFGRLGTRPRRGVTGRRASPQLAASAGGEE